MHAAVDKAMKKFNDLNQQEFDSTIETWDNKFTFQKKESFTQSHKEVSVYTYHKVYKYLNDGTSVRYATMGPRFRPKTAPGRIRAMPGFRGDVYINKNRPRPGIKARKFDLQIKTKLEPKFFELVSKAVLEFTEGL
jgi:hypothetical protein